MRRGAGTEPWGSALSRGHRAEEEPTTEMGRHSRRGGRARGCSVPQSKKVFQGEKSDQPCQKLLFSHMRTETWPIEFGRVSLLMVLTTAISGRMRTNEFKEWEERSWTL